MPLVTLAAPGLLVQWTDPRAIAAGLAALALVGVIAALLRRERDAGRAASAGASGPTASSGPASARAGSGPPATPEDLKQRAEASENPLAGGSGDSVAEMLASEDVPDTELLSRFVRDADGETVGETMTVTEDEVVIKRDDEFLAVDPDVVIEKNGNLVLDPNVDWDAARERGESWREANLDRMEYDDEGLPED